MLKCRKNYRRVNQKYARKGNSAVAIQCESRSSSTAFKGVWKPARHTHWGQVKLDNPVTAFRGTALEKVCSYQHCHRLQQLRDEAQGVTA